MAEYIKLDKKKINRLRNEAHQFDTDIACAIGTDFMQNIAEAENKMILDILNGLENEPTADVVPVVRCKDCRHFQPAFVLTNDGERRPYTEEEKQSGFGLVSAEKGINCGSRCERFGCWEQNSIPVWFSENDYCSYGERRSDNGKTEKS